MTRNSLLFLTAPLISGSAQQLYWPNPLELRYLELFNFSNEEEREEAGGRAEELGLEERGRKEARE